MQRMPKRNANRIVLEYFIQRAPTIILFLSYTLRAIAFLVRTIERSNKQYFAMFSCYGARYVRSTDR